MIDVAQGASNEEAAALLQHVNSSGKAFLVDTELSGQRVLRFAVGGAHTQERHVRAAWALLQDAAGAVLEKKQVPEPEPVLKSGVGLQPH